MPSLEYYWTEWEKDSQVDRTELGEESIKIPQLHHKYYKQYSVERLTLAKYKSQLKVLRKNKYLWYLGILPEEDLIKFGWKPNPLSILKTDIPLHLDADDDVVELEDKIEYVKEKVEYLENIIKTLGTRSYQINNAIMWEKFKVGL